MAAQGTLSLVIFIKSVSQSSYSFASSFSRNSFTWVMRLYLIRSYCQSGVWRSNSGVGACVRVSNTNTGSGSLHSTSTCPANYIMTGLACKTTDTGGDSVQYDAMPRVIAQNSVTCSRIGAGSTVVITSTSICCPF